MLAFLCIGSLGAVTVNIIGFISDHQLNIMLFLSGICAIMTVMTVLTKSLARSRRRILAMLELAAVLLLMFDRFAYVYRGDPGVTGYWMVRISNFMVFYLILYLLHEVTLYLILLYSGKGVPHDFQRRLHICELLFTLGTVLLFVSQFTGLYYTFDESNLYHRSPGSFISFLVPLLISFLQVSVVVQYRKYLNKPLVISLLLNAVVPIIASIIQYFVYGISLTNITIVGMVIILHLNALVDLNKEVEHARQTEITVYKEARIKEHDLFKQTMSALVNAIDAKDKYTNGHSHRVAAYSERIAREAGKSDEYCEELYFTALLHDVGKIGIEDSIINKEGTLTSVEFDEIKQHPLMGSQILSSIEQSPYLVNGAIFHHERYDGTGYPRGLKGEEIPEMARIIAVADAYDAMTSKRSYRDPLPQSAVRAELVRERGKQFDPFFADVMIRLMDNDEEYTMRENAELPEPAANL